MEAPTTQPTSWARSPLPFFLLVGAGLAAACGSGPAQPGAGPDLKADTSPAETSRAAPRPAPILDARSGGGLAYDRYPAAGAGDASAPLVVLIHGSNLDRRLWDDEVEWLVEEDLFAARGVLRYDLRGQGGSVSPREPYSSHGDLRTLLEEVGGAPEAVLVGLSSGAQVALDLALETPDRVAGLVLVSPSLAGYVPEETPAFFAQLGEALQAGDFDRANEILLASPIAEVPEVHRQRVREMVEDNERLWTLPYELVQQAEVPALERLEEVGAPVLILVGEEDLAAVRAQGELMEERMPDARLVVVPGGGHLLNLTSPEVFRREVGEFLMRHE